MTRTETLEAIAATIARKVAAERDLKRLRLAEGISESKAAIDGRSEYLATCRNELATQRKTPARKKAVEEAEEAIASATAGLARRQQLLADFDEQPTTSEEQVDRELETILRTCTEELEDVEGDVADRG